MYIQVQDFAQTQVFHQLDYIPMCGITESHGNSKFNILRNFQLFSKVATSLHFHKQKQEDSTISLSSPTLVIAHLFDYSHPSVYEVLFHCGLICLFLMTNDVYHLFMCLLATTYLLWRNVYSIQMLCPLVIYNCFVEI